MADYTNYTNKEMQAVTIAKEIKDGQIVVVGTG
ncbi:MAG: CoA-transferase subunit beta, partial [Bacillota bacterium]|nr:CoA-transferase subunit beta [Bacillota bacterium]